MIVMIPVMKMIMDLWWHDCDGDIDGMKMMMVIAMMLVIVTAMVMIMDVDNACPYLYNSPSKLCYRLVRWRHSAWCPSRFSINKMFLS